MNRNLTQFRPSETHNLRVPTARNGRGALSITCSQSCWNLQFLLTNTDAYFDSGHQSFNLFWAKLLAIRRFLFCLVFINLNKYIRLCHNRISDASLAYRACVRVCVNSVGCGSDYSDQAVMGSLFLSSTILLLKLVINIFLQSFSFLLIEMTVVSNWQNPAP